METNIKTSKHALPSAIAEHLRAEAAKRELLEYYKARRAIYPIVGDAEAIEHG